MKSVEWLGTARKEVRSFPTTARAEIGYQLYRVQNGLDPSDWKPLPSVGSGVQEIRVQTQNAYRVIYVATFKDAVYVLHVFQKKTMKTRQNDITVARDRLQTLIRRKSHGTKK